jgi:hypothetical protein
MLRSELVHDLVLGTSWGERLKDFLETSLGVGRSIVNAQRFEVIAGSLKHDPADGHVIGVEINGAHQGFESIRKGGRAFTPTI